MTGEIRSVGFIGLGDMGSKQARAISRLPVELTVFDMRDEAMAAFAESATLASSVAEAGVGKDLVGICVQTEAQVNSCIDVLLPVMKPGSVILIHATITPSAVVKIGERAREKGIDVADAPVTRTRPGSGEDGPFVFCPLGGDEAIKDRVQPILDTFATDTLLAGPLGSAMALKICNNLASWCEIAVGLEAFRLAESVGITSETLLTLMGTNGILTPPMRIFEGFRTNPPDGEQGRQWLAGAASQGEKDLKLAESLAETVGADTPIATFVRQMVQQSVLDIGKQ